VSPLSESPLVDLVVPVYNEEAVLERNICRLRGFLNDQFPFSTRVTIADNASTDATWAVASDLASSVPGVRAIRLPQKGRGRALRAVWSKSDATVVGYMDVDLSTDLHALLPLVAPLVSGHSDVAIGSRLARGASVIRGPKRELISRCYNLIVRASIHTAFTDAQCGFKALRSDVARRLLRHVVDNEWFFDTELLVQAERLGYRIHEIPVDWVDDDDSRVDIGRTALADLRGLWRLLRQHTPPGSQRRSNPGWAAAVGMDQFASVGMAGIVAFVGIFLVFRGPLGPYAANVAALLLCVSASIVAHARSNFGGRPLGWQRSLLGGATTLATDLPLTTAVLVGVTPAGSAFEQSVALVMARLLGALSRFVLARWASRCAYRREGASSRRGAPGEGMGAPVDVGPTRRLREVDPPLTKAGVVWISDVEVPQPG